MLYRTDNVFANVKFPPGQHTKYRRCSSSARPGRKQATFPAFYGTCRFITAFTTAHQLSLPQPNQSIPLPIKMLTVTVCFLPGWAKDLSAPRLQVTRIKAQKFNSNSKILNTNQMTVYLISMHCCTLIKYRCPHFGQHHDIYMYIYIHISIQEC